MTPSGEAVFTDVFAFRDGSCKRWQERQLEYPCPLGWQDGTRRDGSCCLPNPTIWARSTWLALRKATCATPAKRRPSCATWIRTRERGNAGARALRPHRKDNHKRCSASANDPRFREHRQLLRRASAGASREFTCQIGNALTSGPSETGREHGCLESRC